MAADHIDAPVSPVASFKLDQDRKRDIDHRRKYAYGAEDVSNGIGPGARADWPNHFFTRTRPRSAKVIHNEKVGRRRSWIYPPLEKWHNEKKMTGKHSALRTDRDELSCDSSNVSMDDDDSVANSDVAYSYDAATGPSQGNHILSHAINQAVARFENKATEKLVHDEYDVVNNEVDARDGYVADEDDFELV